MYYRGTKSVELLTEENKSQAELKYALMGNTTLNKKMEYLQELLGIHKNLEKIYENKIQECIDSIYKLTEPKDAEIIKIRNHYVTSQGVEKEMEHKSDKQQNLHKIKVCEFLNKYIPFADPEELCPEVCARKQVYGDKDRMNDSAMREIEELIGQMKAFIEAEEDGTRA